MKKFLKNRWRFPPEELAKYAGTYVAWNPDGKSIVASDKDELKLDRAIKRAGYDPADVLVSFVPFPNEVVLGGGEGIE